MEFITADNLISLLTLTLLEIVLGIDNIIFISIIVARLPVDQQDKARKLGLTLALVMRVILLMFVSWIAQLTNPLINIFGFELSGRDLIMLAGGLFLLAKSTMEIHNKLEGEEHGPDGKGKATFSNIIFQIILLDLVFSLDSVITAVGLVKELWVMITAVMISIGVMLIFAKAIGEFIDRHPTVKMLALSFLLMVGMVLFAEGLHFHVEKGYVYTAMAFSMLVEFLNIRLRKKSKPPVNLRRDTVGVYEAKEK
ncbi:MAG TPA: TerC family protein [Patescibacteria group bacterium]|nr:TerC family protein [Patescibacteria group bacterium]